MRRLFLFFGALFGGLGVSLGAFGTHTLKARMTPELVATFETGVRYQIYHALALLVLAMVAERRPGDGFLGAGGWLFLAGILLFQGASMYSP